MANELIGRIGVRELHEKVRAGEVVDVLDVRTEEEYRRGHVPGVRLVPLDQLTAEKAVAGQKGEGPVYVICQSGHRSMMACKKLAGEGMKVVQVDGVNLTVATA